jgi:dimethylaniline monooxygenase (N-oxide forming)
MMRPLFRLAGGDLSGTALPEPDHLLGAKPITVCDQLVEMVRRGQIAVAPEVVELSSGGATLRDGTFRRANGLLYATGYTTTFPFLPATADPPSTERAPLYRGVASLAARNLFYVGLVIAHGALTPVMEAQANWVADVISGRLLLPATDMMGTSLKADQAARRRNFDPRFGFIWDRLPYLRALEKESRMGAKRPGRTLAHATEATVA